MQDSPRRLRPLARPTMFSGSTRPGEGLSDGWPIGRGEQRRLIRRVRAARRAFFVLLWTLIAIVVQSVCVLLPGRAKVVFPRIYWAWFCRLLGLRVRVVGRRATSRQGPGPQRRVVFASSHSSWLDVPVLGGRLEACFIAKEEVRGWPFVRTVARLGRSVFVSRQRSRTLAERDELQARLARGDNLILFPEGTTSDGSRVMRFRSAFFAVTPTGPDAPGDALIQPVSVVYDRLAYLPAGRETRPLFAWYGDMDIATHFWRLAQHRGLRATVLLHPPLDPRAFPDRKSLAHATWLAVDGGAAALRQNRPARPIAAAPAPVGEPVYG
jgi:1-acyl-sn-glycerol-3-phosphate acyltransferase